MSDEAEDVVLDKTQIVKIKQDVHARLKLIAKEEGLTMGTVLDHFCRAMIEYCDDPEDSEFRASFFRYLKSIGL